MFAIGDESASPARVPIARIGEPSTFTFPLFTKNNIEFTLLPEIEQKFRLFFTVPYNVTDFFFYFKELKAIKISKPTVHGRTEK